MHTVCQLVLPGKECVRNCDAAAAGAGCNRGGRLAALQLAQNASVYTAFLMDPVDNLRPSLLNPSAVKALSAAKPQKFAAISGVLRVFCSLRRWLSTHMHMHMRCVHDADADMPSLLQPRALRHSATRPPSAERHSSRRSHKAAGCRPSSRRATMRIATTGWPAWQGHWACAGVAR